MRNGVKQAIFLLVILLALWVGVRFLMPLVLPFLLGAGMALAAEPGVRFLSERLRLPRSAASGVGVSGVFLALCALLTVLMTFTLRELGLLARILPDLEGTVMEGLDALQGWLLTLSQGTSPGIRSLIQRNVNDLFSDGAALLDQFTKQLLELMGSFLSHVPDSALGVGTAVLSAFLISSELPKIRGQLSRLLSRQRLQSLLTLAGKLKSTAGLWLLAQMKLSGITCILLAVGFLLLRIAYAPLWAVLVAMLDALPVLGTGTVLVPWSVVCLLQSDRARAVGLLGLYITAALTRSTLEPKLVGKQLGLDPLVTLIALYVGFRLWGLAGMILMPLLAITVVQLLPQQAQ